MDMEILNNIFLNKTSFLMFMCASYSALTAIFLIAIKDKSAATKKLALTAAYLTLLYLSYFVSNSVYYDKISFYRWFAVGSVLIGIAYFTQFFFNFPNERRPRVAKTFFIVQLTVAAVTTGIFVFDSLS